MINEGYIDRVKALARLAAEENEFPVAALVIQDDQVPSINEKEDINKFHRYLEENKIQNLITQNIINE